MGIVSECQHLEVLRGEAFCSMHVHIGLAFVISLLLLPQQLQDKPGLAHLQSKILNHTSKHLICAVTLDVLTTSKAITHQAMQCIACCGHS
jgi:hypothetical protein